MPYEMDEIDDELDIVQGAIEESADEGDALGGFFSKLWKNTKKVVKSGMVKKIAGATAIIYPPVGIPLAAGLAVADKVVAVEEGTRGTKKQQKQVQKAMKHTAALARRGHRGAKRTMALVRTAREVQQAQRAQTGAHRGILITDSGKVIRGYWARA